jgi:hypothetical protein
VSDAAVGEPQKTVNAFVPSTPEPAAWLAMALTALLLVVVSRRRSVGAMDPVRVPASVDRG